MGLVKTIIVLLMGLIKNYYWSKLLLAMGLAWSKTIIGDGIGLDKTIIGAGGIGVGQNYCWFGSKTIIALGLTWVKKKKTIIDKWIGAGQKLLFVRELARVKNYFCVGIGRGS